METENTSGWFQGETNLRSIKRLHLTFRGCILKALSPHFAKTRRFQAKNALKKEIVLLLTAKLFHVFPDLHVWAADGGRHPAGTSTSALCH